MGNRFFFPRRAGHETVRMQSDALTRATRRTQAMQLKMTVEAAKQRALKLMTSGYH